MLVAKMSHGTYDVDKGERGSPRPQDTSYRSCLCTMLIFLIICIIILLATYPWNKERRRSYSYYSNEYLSDSEKTVSTTSSNSPITTNYTTTTTSTTTTTTSTSGLIYEIDPRIQNSTEEDEYEPRKMTLIPEDEPIENQTKMFENENSTNLVIIESTTAFYKNKTTTPNSEDTTTTMIEQNVEVFKKQNETSKDKENYANLFANEDETSTILTTTDQTRKEDDFNEYSGNRFITDETTTDSTPEEQTLESTTPKEITIIDEEKDINHITTTEMSTTKLFSSTSTSTITDQTTSTTSTTTTSTLATTTESIPIISTKNETEEIPVKQDESKVCQTAECKYISSRMLSMINHTVDPCYDFYEYACGGLRNNPNLLVEDLGQDVSKRILDGLKFTSNDESKGKFKTFYESCINYDQNVLHLERIEEALKTLKESGDVLEFRDDDEKFLSLTQLLINLIKNNSPFLFDIFIEPNEEGILTLTLTLPKQHSPFYNSQKNTKDQCKNIIKESYFSMNELYKERQRCMHLPKREKFLNEIETSLKEMNKLKKHLKRNRINIDFQILNLTQHQPSVSEARLQILNKEYRVKTIDEMTNDYGLIDWKLLISSLIDQPINGDEVIHIYFYDYFNNFFKDLNNTFYDTQTPKKDFHNGLLSIYARFLYQDLIREQAPCNREEYCLKVASKLLPEIAGRIYLDSFDNSQRIEFHKRLNTHLNALRDELHWEILKLNTWMDNTSRQYLINKLQNIKFELDGGTEAKFELADTMLKEFTPTANYFTNAINLNKLYRKRIYKLYNNYALQPDIIWSLLNQPFALNSIYDYNLENVVIPYSIFSSPIMSPTLPLYLSAARLGFTLAHDLSHHFDNNGIKKSLKQNETVGTFLKKSFDENVSYLNNFFGMSQSYKLPDGRTATFKLTESEIPLQLNEALADLTAIKLALNAYRNFLLKIKNIETVEGEMELPWLGHKPTQLYFLAVVQMYCSKNTLDDQLVSLFEDEHLPPSQRIALMTSNSIEFSESFHCPIGTNMNPYNKFDTFPHLNEVENSLEIN